MSTKTDSYVFEQATYAALGKALPGSMANFADRGAKKETGAPKRPRRKNPDCVPCGLTEQRQDILFRLSGEGQPVDTELLPGLQGHQVRALFGDIGQG